MFSPREQRPGRGEQFTTLRGRWDLRGNCGCEGNLEQRRTQSALSASSFLRTASWSARDAPPAAAAPPPAGLVAEEVSSSASSFEWTEDADEAAEASPPGFCCAAPAAPPPTEARAGLAAPAAAARPPGFASSAFRAWSFSRSARNFFCKGRESEPGGGGQGTGSEEWRAGPVVCGRGDGRAAGEGSGGQLGAA